MNFIKVAGIDELPNNSSKIVKVKNAKVVLFHYENKITAIGNECLHTPISDLHFRHLVF